MHQIVLRNVLLFSSIMIQSVVVFQLSNPLLVFLTSGFSQLLKTRWRISHEIQLCSAYFLLCLGAAMFLSFGSWRRWSCLSHWAWDRVAWVWVTQVCVGVGLGGHEVSGALQILSNMCGSYSKTAGTPPHLQTGFSIPLLCRTCVTLGRGPGAVRDDKAWSRWRGRHSHEDSNFRYQVGAKPRQDPWSSEEGVVSSLQGKQLESFLARGYILSWCSILFLFCNFYLSVSLIEVYFTHHKIQLLQMYNSMIFSNFTKWREYQHKLVLEHFQPPWRSLVPCTIRSHLFLYPLATTHLLSDSKFAGLYCKGWKWDLELITGEMQELGPRWLLLDSRKAAL